MKISVFGSSSPKPNDPAYQDALKIGKLLAEAGHTVQTGGYMGLMEAASRGAAEAGGSVIGITCEEIEEWRPVKANQWVHHEIKLLTFQERLITIVRECDAAIAMPGGPGTLAEISLTWNLMQTDSMPLKPFILVGAEWQTVFYSFFKFNIAYISTEVKEIIHFAKDSHAAIDLLNKLIEDDLKV